MAGNNLLYDLYERRLAARINPATVPHHVGVILDGNRRWAKSMGFGTPMRSNLSNIQLVKNPIKKLKTIIGIEPV